MADEIKRILVVDDDPNIVVYLTTLLEDSGFATLSAENGRQGMEIAIAEKPDLVLLDITMPEESGVKMFRRLQSEENTKDIPVIIITGISHDFKKFIETRKQIKPPAAYFDKPIEREELLEKIREILS